MQGLGLRAPGLPLGLSFERKDAQKAELGTISWAGNPKT